MGGNFASDNTAGISPAILAAIARANEGPADSYGADAITGRLDRLFGDVFEHEVRVFPVATGTAANALSLSQLTPPWGAIYCHEEAHIAVDEAGAPEQFTGAKLVALEGADGKLRPESITRAIARVRRGDQHQSQPSVLSVSNASEAGTVYSAEEMAALADVAASGGMAVHVDGARFANAVAALNASPADLTWRAGVDVLSFGATKNGAMAAEAVVFFNPELAENFLYRRKRAGHLWSKMRFLSAQLEAYLADDLWLVNARHANSVARRLADGLCALPGVSLVFPVEANELFIRLPAPVADGLHAAGYAFYPWSAYGDDTYRLLTAFDTAEATVDALIDDARRLSDAM